MFRKNIFSSWFSFTNKEKPIYDSIRDSLLNESLFENGFDIKNVEFSDNEYNYNSRLNIFLEKTTNDLKIKISFAYSFPDEFSDNCMIEATYDDEVFKTTITYADKLIANIFNPKHFVPAKSYYEGDILRNTYIHVLCDSLACSISVDKQGDKKFAGGYYDRTDNVLYIATKNKKFSTAFSSPKYKQYSNIMGAL